MPSRLRHTSAVVSADASSTTITSTSLPAAFALATARGSRCGRLCVAMITLIRGICCPTSLRSGVTYVPDFVRQTIISSPTPAPTRTNARSRSARARSEAAGVGSVASMTVPFRYARESAKTPAAAREVVRAECRASPKVRAWQMRADIGESTRFLGASQ